VLASASLLVLASLLVSELEPELESVLGLAKA
jgi:hypothetical protein